MIEEFKWIGREMFESGLVDSHGGNMSVRQGDKILITRMNARLSNLRDEALIEVPLSESSPQDKDASRELVVHRSIYKGTKANAIIHAHPPSAVAISISDNKIVPQDSTGIALFKSAPIIRTSNPIGSEDVARIIPTFFRGDSGVAVVKGHGSFAIGATLEEAYSFTSALELSCKVLIAIRSSASARSASSARHHAPQRRSAIPPSIGVMDRSRNRRRR
jgi:L-fuculose-phosphate aldolase